MLEKLQSYMFEQLRKKREDKTYVISPTDNVHLEFDILRFIQYLYLYLEDKGIGYSINIKHSKSNDLTSIFSQIDLLTNVREFLPLDMIYIHGQQCEIQDIESQCKTNNSSKKHVDLSMLGDYMLHQLALEYKHVDMLSSDDIRDFIKYLEKNLNDYSDDTVYIATRFGKPNQMLNGILGICFKKSVEYDFIVRLLPNKMLWSKFYNRFIQFENNKTNLLGWYDYLLSNYYGSNKEYVVDLFIAWMENYCDNIAKFSFLFVENGKMSSYMDTAISEFTKFSKDDPCFKSVNITQLIPKHVSIMTTTWCVMRRAHILSSDFKEVSQSTLFVLYEYMNTLYGKTEIIGCIDELLKWLEKKIFRLANTEPIVFYIHNGRMSLNLIKLLDRFEKKNYVILGNFMSAGFKSVKCIFPKNMTCTFSFDEMMKLRSDIIIKDTPDLTSIFSHNMKLVSEDSHSKYVGYYIISYRSKNCSAEDELKIASDFEKRCIGNILTIKDAKFYRKKVRSYSDFVNIIDNCNKFGLNPIKDDIGATRGNVICLYFKVLSNDINSDEITFLRNQIQILSNRLVNQVIDNNPNQKVDLSILREYENIPVVKPKNIATILNCSDTVKSDNVLHYLISRKSQRFSKEKQIEQARQFEKIEFGDRPNIIRKTIKGYDAFMKLFVELDRFGAEPSLYRDPKKHHGIVICFSFHSNPNYNGWVFGQFLKEQIYTLSNLE